MLETLRKCSALVGPNAGGRWLLIAALAVVVSGLEALGALLVFGLLAGITSASQGLVLPVVGDLRAVFPGADETTLLVAMGVVIAVFFVVRGAAILVHSYVQYRVAEHAGARLSARLLDGYLAMPYAFHLERNSAELIRNAYDTVGLFVREALIPGVKLVSQSFTVAALVVVLLVTSPLATLLALVLLGPFAWLLLRIAHPRVKQLGVTAQRMSKTSLQSLQQSLHGWRDIKILGRERTFSQEFADDRRELARVRYLRSVAREVPRVALETGLVLFVVAFLGVSAVVEGGPLEALPALAVFGYAAVRLQPSINEIMTGLNSLKFAGPGIDLLHTDLLLFRSTTSELADGGEPLRLERDVTLDGVCFRYPGNPRDTLHDIDLRIAAGEWIGVVGPTGGGKSTLVDVLLGLLQPTAGTVRIDGRDLRGSEAAWHRSLGVVPQMVFLVDDTLRRNIALGVPPDEIDEERVADAVRLAQLDGFVASLPAGLGTVVGERGVRVSGGQRQRLAIARALYVRPDVLVFDEGTSALDTSTEDELMAALEHLRGRTIITVAHRLTTIRGCDRVLLVEDGRIVDAAPYAELAGRHEALQTITR